ncbi:PEP-CTERM sorting domain-containing protein [bacterium]|nr:PEP-CTERM sorting domain-containing protein [bacterium]
MKNTLKLIGCWTLLGLVNPVTTHAVVTIAHVENSAIGYFVDSGGVNLVSTGEVSFGYFSTDGTSANIYQPDSNAWASLLSGGAGNAWGSLLSLGWRDVRTLGTLGTGFDPSFSTGGSPTTNIGATVQNIPFASVPSNTRLYILGFNAGSWDNTTKTATFGSATEWGVVSAWGHATSSQNFASPADGGTKSMNFKNAALTSSDVLVGSLVSSANGVVAMVPEPSTGALMMIGAFGLVAMRRLRKV